MRAAPLHKMAQWNHAGITSKISVNGSEMHKETVRTAIVLSEATGTCKLVTTWRLVEHRKEAENAEPRAHGERNEGSAATSELEHRSS